VPDNGGEQNNAKGSSLTLIYGLVGLALVAAIGFALMIVLYFYLR
jgi:hypothetical protein